LTQAASNSGISTSIAGGAVAVTSGDGANPLAVANTLTGSSENAIGTSAVAGSSLEAVSADSDAITVAGVTATATTVAEGATAPTNSQMVGLDGNVTELANAAPQTLLDAVVTGDTSTVDNGLSTTGLTIAEAEILNISALGTPEITAAGPGAVDINTDIGDVMGPNAIPSIISTNVDDQTFSANEEALLEDLNIDNMIGISVASATNPLVNDVVIGESDNIVLDTIDANTQLASTAEASVAIVDTSVNTAVSSISTLPVDNQALPIDEIFADDAANAQVSFGPATVAVPDILTSDGGLGNFIFGFLDGFNLVDAENGFDLAGGNTLFTFNDAPDAEFLFTTNPGFSDIGELFDSNFFFDQLNVDRDTNFLRLGDGFFESLLIADQIKKATRQAQLPQFGDKLEQAHALMQAAVDQQLGLGLTLGIALTADQVSSLNNSIVWWVSQLVDGREVLVPVVYLSAADQKSYGNGAFR